MSLTTNAPLLTFLDATDHVLDQVLGGDASVRNRRQAVRAVQEAYAEIPMRRMWRYYQRPLTIQTVASQTSSTITYTASSRSVTLASGTWPTDAIKYAIYINNARHTVATRSSSTVLILDEKDAPTANIAAGTSYTLARDTYELPSNFRSLIKVVDVLANNRPIACVEPADVIEEQYRFRGASLPVLCGVYRSEHLSGSLAIHFAPSPSTARVYNLFGHFWPQELKTLDYNLGTVSTTADSTALVGVGTTFTSDHVGAVIRISPSGSLKLPTDIQGEIDKNRLEPYAQQRVIRSRTDGTNLVLEQAADSALTTSGYRISSRIDIEPGAMRNAFLRCCEAKFATQDRAGSEQREAKYERALAFAMAADQRIQDTSPGGFAPNSLADVAASVSLTTGGVQP